jgi:hypothetical protein
VRTRVLLGAAGVVVGAYGAYLLLSRQEGEQLTSAAIWLASGVVIHDFVIAPLVVAVVALGARVLPAPARVPAVVGMVVLGTVTAFAIPVLTRFGNKVDDDGLLDRSYVTSWLVVAAVVLLGVVVAAVTRARRTTGVS